MFTNAQLERERRREVEEKLAAHGLVRGPSRLAATPPLAFDDEAFASRLRSALEELGGIFAVLGRFLATRLDLVAVHDSLELARIVDRAPALPAERVAQILRAELGDPAEIFGAFDAAPRSSSLTRQTHRAELRTGEPVLVRLLRPGLDEEIGRELDAARPLERIFNAYGRTVALDAVLDDFRRELEARLDLRREAEALELLAPEGGERQPLAVPRIHPEHTRRRVLVLEDLGGATLDELAPRLADMDREDLARRLGLVWLRQALLGPAFPIEADVIELHDGRLAWTGGVFASLPAPSQGQLWDYLRATSRHDPDQAAACLRRELARGPRAVSDGELRSRLRQVVPFRDGGWSPAGENLAEYAVLHWRVVREYGFQVPMHLVSFYRGLYWAACTAQPFQPDNDPLHDALEDLEWMAGWNQFRQLTTPGQAAATAESYLAGALGLPPKIARALDIAAGGEETEAARRGFRVAADPPADGHRPGDSAAATAALVMAIAALVLVARPLVDQQAFGARTEIGVTLVVAVFALALLRVLWKTS